MIHLSMLIQFFFAFGFFSTQHQLLHHLSCYNDAIHTLSLLLNYYYENDLVFERYYMNDHYCINFLIFNTKRLRYYSDNFLLVASHNFQIIPSLSLSHNFLQLFPLVYNLECLDQVLHQIMHPFLQFRIYLSFLFPILAPYLHHLSLSLLRVVLWQKKVRVACGIWDKASLYEPPRGLIMCGIFKIWWGPHIEGKGEWN